MRDMTFLQADNQMQTFADMTGGMHFMPKFHGRAARRYEGHQPEHPLQV